VRTKSFGDNEKDGDNTLNLNIILSK